MYVCDILKLTCITSGAMSPAICMKGTIVSDSPPIGMSKLVVPTGSIHG